MPVGTGIVAAILIGPFAAFGTLAFCNPELTFRVRHPGHINEVEFSSFGFHSEKFGGLVFTGMMLVIAYAGAGLIGAILTGLVALIPPLYYRRKYGRITVSPIPSRRR